MMRCPKCNKATHVVDSRESLNNEAIRRRRECLGCGIRFTTYETVESLAVIKIGYGQRKLIDVK